MKINSVILPLLLLLSLSGCAKIINPYEENFKCRTRDDAGKCIDTPSAYKEARFPNSDGTNTDTVCTNANGEKITCPDKGENSGAGGSTTECRDVEGAIIPCPQSQDNVTMTKVSKTNINQLTAQNSRYKALTELLEEPDKPMLEPPKIMRVLMLPYKGESDELFMTRFVYLKLKDSQWVLTDIREQVGARQ